MTSTEVLHPSFADVVRDLEAVVAKWSEQEAQAQASASSAKRRLETVSMHGDQEALALLAEIETSGKTQRIAARLRATASAQLAAARTALAREHAAQRRQEATRLWDQWRDHQAHTDELTALLAAHEGLAYVGPTDNHGRSMKTTGAKLLDAALDHDATVSREERDALGESVCVRSGPVRDGVRTVWLSFTAPRLHLTAENWRPVKFLASVDGNPLLAWESTRYEWTTTYTREVPADAVVEMRGETAYSVDDPTDRINGDGR